MLELILGVLRGLVIDIVLSFIFLALSEILQWFLDLKEGIDEEDVAFTLRKEIKNGAHVVYQGVLRQQGETVDIRKIRKLTADRLDQQLQRDHERSPLVTYT